MKTNLSRYQDDLDRLIKLSEQMRSDLILVASNKKVKKGERESGLLFFSSFQEWYSEAHEVIRQILPNRLSEFETLYQGYEKRKSINAQTYTIRDWLLGIRSPVKVLDGHKNFDDAGIIFMQFQRDY